MQPAVNLLQYTLAVEDGGATSEFSTEGHGSVLADMTDINSTTSRLPSSSEKAEFLQWTNLVRCMHGAAPLRWSDAVARGAEALVRNQRRMSHGNPYHERPPAGPAGENLYQIWGKTASAKDAVIGWYKEVYDCATGGPTSFRDGCQKPKSGEMVGHFTALVWKGAKELGCAFGNAANIIVCRYKAGNSLDGNTPNMGGYYQSQVSVRVKSEGQCKSQGTSSGSATCGGSGNGKPCHFPFKYGQRTYNACTSSGFSEPWCATSVKTDGTYSTWGKCNC